MSSTTVSTWPKVAFNARVEQALAVGMASVIALPLVRAIAAAPGGSIEPVSAVGAETCVFVRFSPVALVARPPAA